MKDNKEKLNVNVLVTARNEYMYYLKKQLSKLVLEGFIEIYKDAVETQKRMESYEYTKQFQRFLRAVPEWNQTILVNETKRITSEIVYLQKLVTAIFISEVKILTSIKLGGENKNFHLDMLPSDILVHKIYINLSMTIYNSVDLLNKFKDIENNKINYNIVRNIIEEGIEETVINLIPIKTILEQYLTVVLTDISRDGTPEDDTDSDSDDDKENENKHNFGSEQQLFEKVDETLNQFGSEFGTEETEPEAVDFDNENEFGNVSGPADLTAETIKIGGEHATSSAFGSSSNSELGFNSESSTDFESPPQSDFSFSPEEIAEQEQEVGASTGFTDTVAEMFGGEAETGTESEGIETGTRTQTQASDFDFDTNNPTQTAPDDSFKEMSNYASGNDFGSSAPSAPSTPAARSGSPDEFLQPEGNDSFF